MYILKLNKLLFILCIIPNANIHDLDPHHAHRCSLIYIGPHRLTFKLYRHCRWVVVNCEDHDYIARFAQTCLLDIYHLLLAQYIPTASIINGKLFDLYLYICFCHSIYLYAMAYNICQHINSDSMSHIPLSFISSYMHSHIKFCIPNIRHLQCSHQRTILKQTWAHYTIYRPTCSWTILLSNHSSTLIIWGIVSSVTDCFYEFV